MAISPETIFLDPNHQGSLQSQIQQIVAAAVLSGRFRPGEKMPSSRQLASHLGISRITVTLAYNELVAADYLTTRARSGYFVSDSAPAPIPDVARPKGADSVDWDRVIPRRFSGGRMLEKPAEWSRYPYPFIYGQSDPTLFDQSNWRLCAHQALGRKEFESLTTDYGERDDPQLIEFIARQTLPRRGILARPEEILVTVGAQNALWLAATVLLGPDRHVAFENPCYPGLRDILHLTGAQRHAVHVDDGGLPPQRIPDGVNVVFTTPSHQAPTMVTMPMARRRRLLELAEERDFLVVEDDYEFEMSFLKPPTPALKSLDRSGRVIYVGSFSKSLFPGLRLGYLVGSEAFIREARALRCAVLRHPPGHMMRTTANFLRLGHYDSLIRRMRTAYAERRKVMERAISDNGLTVAARAAFGGSGFWMRAPEDVSTSALEKRLLRDGVVIEAGAPFFGGATPDDRHYRLSYTSIPADRIPEGIARIARAIRH